MADHNSIGKLRTVLTSLILHSHYIYSRPYTGYYSLWHMLEGIGQVLLAEGQLASSPDFGILFQLAKIMHTSGKR